ncbi:hypothetical protein HNQ02_002986 [Flavobacterium sp. 7E]|uniref:hypothetical protein n=1 Tax=Flavobacterium sp. 7E TaxID=2735898 RepID=UPI00156E9AAC|nr:hypothetical protein [Flavobacterium sp. 7E]NRS90051.1 hypothetical protein [Flavobacterium sp. 7E]
MIKYFIIILVPFCISSCVHSSYSKKDLTGTYYNKNYQFIDSLIIKEDNYEHYIFANSSKKKLLYKSRNKWNVYEKRLVIFQGFYLKNKEDYHLTNDKNITSDLLITAAFDINKSIFGTIIIERDFWNTFEKIN